MVMCMLAGGPESVRRAKLLQAHPKLWC